MATTSWPDLERVASRRARRSAGPVAVDLDDGEVGQRVDAVDRAGEDAAVLELDVSLSPPSTTWRLVRIQPLAS